LAKTCPISISGCSIIQEIAVNNLRFFYLISLLIQDYQFTICGSYAIYLFIGYSSPPWRRMGIPLDISVKFSSG
jgi:hypothetical protein